MKVMQLLPALELGGTERGVVDLARAMKKNGHETVVVSSGGALVSELQKVGVPHYTLAVHKKSIASFFLVKELVKIIHREGVDIIHARSRVPGWIGWLAARKAGIPFMTTCHGHYSVHAMSRVMGWGKRVIVASHAIGRRMIDLFNVPADRIRLIPRGVDLSQFVFSGSKKFEKKTTIKYIVLIGRFSPIKGQVEFIKAVHLLRSQMPHFKVSIVGSEGRGKHKYTNLMKKTIQQFGLENTIKILPPTRHVASLLSQADLLVLPSLTPEPFGRVIIEAGAVGTPVAATCLGGVPDIIDDGKNGILFPPHNILAMAEAMREVLTNTEKAKAFAFELRKKVEEKFSLEQMVEKTLTVYDEIRRKKKILVIKLGALGDLVLIVPSLRMLREKNPEADISLVVDRKLAPIISECPYIDDLVLIERKKLSNFLYLFKTARRIAKENFDWSIDFQNNKWTHLLAYLGGVTQRYGFSRGKFGFLLNRGDDTYDTPDSPLRHQFRVLSKTGISKFNDKLELWVSKEDIEKSHEAFASINITKEEKVVGLILGSSPKWETKRWPVENFARLAQKLIQRQNVKVVLFGAPNEANLANMFENFPKEKILNLIGKTRLDELPAYFKSLSLVVTGDSAPLHIAAAMDVPIIALFGPTDAKRHAPPAKKIDILFYHTRCQPCYKGVCSEEENQACLRKVSVDEVYDHAKRILEK